MGQKIKIKSNTVLRSNMECGVHLVTITDMKMARDSNKGLVSTKDGEMAIDVVFSNKDSKSATQRFWLTDKAMWMLDALCKAIGVDRSNGEVPVEQVIGKQLWIIMGAEFKFENGDLIRLQNGTPEAFTRIVPKFFPVVTEGIRPILQGDPRKNNGIPGGDFLLNSDLDIEAWWNPQKAAALMHGLQVHRDIEKKIMQPNANADASPFKSDAEIDVIKARGTGPAKEEESFGTWAYQQIYGRELEEDINDEF